MDWYNWFVEYGIDGLYDDQRSGRTPFLAKENKEKFLQSLEKLQEEKEGGRTTGEDIRLLLKEKFNAKYSLNGVYDLLKRLNIVWITGRSIHPKADLEKQEEFKKKLPRSNKKMSSRRRSIK
ncbi:MAG: winged helix-turn-helix domain-containing protein [Candidatus Melainabacteria bacterium]|nr:winged helix-turn-helix domain-containing protein [Candidatus Melainabacteria bacterium]